MAYFVAISLDGGVPLFTRASAGLPKLSIAAMGSLYGVSFFTGTRDVELRNTKTDTAVVTWKSSTDIEIMMVLIVDNDFSTQSYSDNLIGLIEAAMIATAGRVKLRSSAARLQGIALRKSYTLIDTLLNSLRSATRVGPMLGCVDRTLVRGDSTLQQALDIFEYQATSSSGVLLVDGRVLVGTKKFWELSVDQRLLLCSSGAMDQGDFETRLFFENKAEVELRWVGIKLVQNVTVCLLCGETPSLADIKSTLVGLTWGEHMEELEYIRNQFPTNIPLDQRFPEGLQGLLIVNTRFKWASFSGIDVSSTDVSSNMFDPSTESQFEHVKVKELTQTQTAKAPSLMEKKIALCAWYKSIVAANSHDIDGVMPADHEPEDHALAEAYLCTTAHKFYLSRTAVRLDGYHIAALFDTSVSTFALRDLMLVAYNQIESLL